MSEQTGGRRAAVVFDLGGVLVDWHPRYLYQALIPDADEREWFFTHVCSGDWIEQQDSGRSWSAANAELIGRFPQHRHLIEAFRERWLEMLRGPIVDSVALLERLHARGVRLLALTNWAADTYQLALPQLPFLQRFEAVLVSGEVGLVKPDRRIFDLFIERFGVDPAVSLFVDDRAANVTAARAVGFDAVEYQSAELLEAELSRRGLLPAGSAGQRP